MVNYADELRRLAATIDESIRELNLARVQSTKHKHLMSRAGGAVVQSARVVVDAIDLGFSEICPAAAGALSAMRGPNYPTSPPLQRSMFLCGSCMPDGSLSDDTAFNLWVNVVCRAMHACQTTAKADAGAYDFPTVKTDAQGRILGRDGRPLQVARFTNTVTGESQGAAVQGEPALVTDDYDEADDLEHLRSRVAHWVDVCYVLADLIRREASIAEAQTVPPTQPRSGEQVGDSDARLPSGFSGGAELADALGVHSTRRKAFFKQLQRRRNSLGNCCREVQNPPPNSPQFLYRADSPELRDLAAEYAKPSPA